MDKVNIFWFRRDLRLEDNAGLYHALKEGLPVVPVFVFDSIILDQLDDKKDRRVIFIREALVSMQKRLVQLHSSLEVHIGTPEQAFAELVKKYAIHTVFANHDYEPYALKRDASVKRMLASYHTLLKTFKDQVIFEKDEIIKEDGKPYTVYTPYSRKWKKNLGDADVKAFPTEKYFHNFYRQPLQQIPLPGAIGFEEADRQFPPKDPGLELIKHYNETRDFPAMDGTSRLGVHLRFGTVSIRDWVSRARGVNITFLNELIWREFYMAILWHFPHVGEHKSFKPEYDQVQWRNNEEEFERWCKGLTGFPIVDAGMRQLNKTGYMHNRIRMIAGSFLCKDLLIDWRWGEAYFAQKLLDYDLAANNGGWQWVAGSGCDAAPYFRIFNPELQTIKFDKELKYISKWVPEFRELNYPKPIVDHAMARNRCLAAYKDALSQRQMLK